jgi:hypothetical protein
MDKKFYQKIRLFLNEFGRIATVKYIRSTTGLTFKSASVIVEDIQNKKRWTYT